MNNVNNIINTEPYIALTDTVDLEWLKNVEPRFHEDFIKFTVDVPNQIVYIGMDIHRDCVPFEREVEEFVGGNIFFDDGHIEYESTLNIQHNLEENLDFENPRVITDKSKTQELDKLLFKWVKL